MSDDDSQSRPNISGGVNISGGAVSVGGDLVGRDKIIHNIQNIQQRALTFAEEAEKEQSLESRKLAQGISAFVQRLRSRAEAVESGTSPYKGLLEYRLSDAEIFFGRDHAVRELLKSLANGSLTILHAESGAGKSSLLQAGISPRLIAAGHLPIYLRPYRDDPTLIIKRAFISDPGLTPTLATAPLRDFLRQVCNILGAQTTLYIFLDQFEEFFTQLSEPERAEFIRELAECLDDTTLNVRWLLALRTEHFGNLANFRPRIRNPFENDYRLNRLTRAEAHTVILEPARRRGITFEEGLIDSLLDDLGKNEIAPPQIQLVCESLYEELGEGETTITRAIYEREGKAAGILRGHLERVLSRDLLPPQRAAARRLLETLITSESQRIIRTHTELVAELSKRGVTPETLDVILSQLVDSRLLRAEESDDGLAYELAHDYLLSEIKLDPDVQARKAAQELLEQETRAYNRFKTLLTEDRLKVIEPYQNELRFTPASQQLFHESRAVLTRQRRAGERRRRLLLGVAGVVAVVMTVLGFIAIRQSQEAQNQAKVAFSRQLAAQSQANVSSQLDLALLLSMESYRMRSVFEARDVLFKSLYQRNILAFLRGHNDAVYSVAFSADGKTLASGSLDNTIILWDVTNIRAPKQMSIVRGHKSKVASLAFSLDGKTLASGSEDNTIILWDVTNPRAPTQLSTASGHKYVILSLAFSPDGKTLASGSGDATVIVWDVTNPKSPTQLSALLSHTDVVYSVAISPDGKTLASGSRDRTIILWDMTNPKSPTHLSVLSGRNSAVLSVSFGRDGKTLASGNDDKTVILWDVTNPKSPTQLNVLSGHDDAVNSVAFSLDGKTLASGSEGRTIILWDVTNPKSTTQLSVLSGHNNAVRSVAFGIDGKTLASGSDDKTVILWDVTNPNSPTQLNVLLSGHNDAVYSVAFSLDGKTLASGSKDKTVILWDVTSRKSPTQLNVLSGHNNAVSGLAFSAYANMFASGSWDKTIILWDVTNPKSPTQLNVLSGHSKEVSSLTFSPDGKTLISGSGDATVIIWDVSNSKSPKQLSELSAHKDLVDCLALSADGKILASGSGDKTVILWDITNPKSPTQLTVLSGHNDAVYSVAFSPDGKTLASGSRDRTIILWDVTNPKSPTRLSVLSGYKNAVRTVAFGTDGKTLASGSDDKMIILWDVTNPKSPTQLNVLSGHKNSPESIAFSPDGKTLASGSGDKTIILWDIDVNSWRNDACQIVRRNLTQAEWKQYLGDEPYRKTCEEFAEGE